MAEETQRKSTTEVPPQTRRKARPAGEGGNQQRSQVQHSGEPQRRKPTNRAAGVEPARRGPNRHAPRPTKRQGEKKGLRVPLIPALLVLVTCVVLTAVVTRAIVVRTSLTKTAPASTQASSSSNNTSATGQVNQQEPVEVKDTASGTTSSTSNTSTTNSSTSSASSTSSSSTTTSTSTPTGVKSPWITTGTFTTGDAKLDEEVKAFCDSHANTNMDLDTALLEVYKGVAWSEYVERDDAQHPSGKNWRTEYAHKYYEHDCSGNCYEFAAFLSFCLQYMGLSDAHAEGVLVELQSGGWGDHGLVYVTNTDGTDCLCDTSLGTNGWMLKASSYNVQLQDFENA